MGASKRIIVVNAVVELNAKGREQLTFMLENDEGKRLSFITYSDGKRWFVTHYITDNGTKFHKIGAFKDIIRNGLNFELTMNRQDFIDGIYKQLQNNGKEDDK